jgi:sugar/nucleoside kinase (ribokinase family)
MVVWDRQGWLSRTRDASAISNLHVEHRLLISNVDEAIDEGIIDQKTGVVTLPSGFDAAILKDARRGAMVVEAAGRRIAIPAYPVDVPNNVGSGDIFAGVVVAEVSRGAALEQAASLAAAATSAVLATQDTAAPPDLRELAEEVTRAAESSRAFDWRWQCETGG